MIVHEGHSSIATSVAFSPDGNSVASGSRDMTIRMWDAQSSSSIGMPMSGPLGWVESISYSPLGNIIASGSQDSSIRLWDVNTGQQIGQPLENDQPFLSIAFSPDAKLIASGC
ncbi:unnamed protein product, partial [Rhizoctonia solani]